MLPPAAPADNNVRTQAEQFLKNLEATQPVRALFTQLARCRPYLPHRHPVASSPRAPREGPAAPPSRLVLQGKYFSGLAEILKDEVAQEDIRQLAGLMIKNGLSAEVRKGGRLPVQRVVAAAAR